MELRKASPSRLRRAPRGQSRATATHAFGRCHLSHHKAVSVAAADIVGDLRQAIALLTDLNVDAATRAAQVFTRMLAGEDFTSAADLPSGWRRSLQTSARDAALTQLLSLFENMEIPDRAHRIAQGVARAARHRGVRPDGEIGLYVDLVNAGIQLSARSWRRVIAEHRGQTERALATRALALWSRPITEK